MSLNDILDSLFPAGHTVSVDGQVITGEAQTAQGTVTVLGTTDAAAIDHRMALALADCVLNTIEQYPGRPLVFSSIPAAKPYRAVRSCSASMDRWPISPVALISPAVRVILHSAWSPPMPSAAASCLWPDGRPRLCAG